MFDPTEFHKIKILDHFKTKEKEFITTKEKNRDMFWRTYELEHDYRVEYEETENARRTLEGKTRPQPARNPWRFSCQRKEEPCELGRCLALLF